ncbi:MAG: D-alanyl-D-alanine carboxypeptidase [Corynebacterium provencense]|jgi:D-alanyl-D-alanine carboxypeptidase/D-alanyl-D-alanine-endopeptidase (penicillin-binding protein 4)|uniref:D-alanyl-D-alanine carboxypeptidase n=1 Tax=Corynebacterium provencense TaxID=1737425 RepID=UPI002989B75C|nr:D-alanyl-D-alanine carboxypeptidase [Corynebacterium provencense]
MGGDGSRGTTAGSGRPAPQLKRWVISVIAFTVAAVVVVTAALVVRDRTMTRVAAVAEIPAATAVVQAAPPAADSGGDEQDAAEVGDAARILSGPSGDAALGRLSGRVTDVATGQEIWASSPDTPLVPASATKLATATAALLTLPSDDRVPTSVYRGTVPGQVVLKGGGDVTLQRTPGSGFFTGAASLSDLAAQAVTASAGVPVTSVVVDNSVREGDLFNRTWSTDDVAAGNVAPLGAVMVDAGRLDPADNYSPRSGTPAADAGRALAEALGADAAAVTVSDAPVAVDGEALATVWSAALPTRLRDMMLHSDNLLAEAVGREVAASRGLPQTFDGATRAVLNTLGDHGIPVGDAVLADCSGMSGDNRLTARILDSLLALAAGAPGDSGGDSSGEDDGGEDGAGGTAELRSLFDALPVAAADGTLADRYLPGSGAETVAGRVRAKTGTLDGVNALAGTLTTDTGRVLTFAFLSNGSQPDAGRAALDRLAAALRRI